MKRFRAYHRIGAMHVGTLEERASRSSKPRKSWEVLWWTIPWSAGSIEVIPCLVVVEEVEAWQKMDQL